MKKCNLCLESKEVSNFGKEPRVADGLQGRCRSCKNKENKKWSSKNKEKIAANQRVWRAKNPEKSLMYAEKYRDSKRISNRLWHLKNKDKNRAYLRARRARVTGSNFEFFTEYDLLKRYGSNCYICNKKINLDAPRKIGNLGWELGLHVEHVTPISKGGGTTLENTRPSHGICNLRKGASEIDYISR